MVDIAGELAQLDREGWCVLARIIPEPEIDRVRHTSKSLTKKPELSTRYWVARSVVRPDLKANQGYA